jgi:hypothetical protein
MERDYIARQVSAVGDPAVITIATDLPANATHFVITCVAGVDALTLTLTSTTGPITHFFSYGINPWLKIDLRTSGITAFSLDGGGAGDCTIIGYWIGV